MGIPLSVWLAFSVGLAFPAIFFAIEFRLERQAVRKGNYITLTPLKRSRDPKKPQNLLPPGEEIGFDPRHGHYMKIAEVFVTVASASLVFIPTLHFPLLPKLAFPLVLLGLAVIFGVSFMALLTYFYEMFLFDPRNFTAFRSSLVFALGFGGLFCFGLAYIALALIAGTAIGNGTLVASSH